MDSHVALCITYIQVHSFRNLTTLALARLDFLFFVLFYFNPLLYAPLVFSLASCITVTRD